MNEELMSLCEAYQKYFYIGAAISPPSITRHADLLKKHFNSLTCENQMKYEPMHPEEGKWVFEPADQIVNFARENGMKMRMHAPVWHAQTPKWFFDANGRLAPRELVYERLEQHIKVLCEHYANDVYAWDVVNEATNDKLDEVFIRRFGNNPYRLTDYLTTCGVEYLEKAYHLARKYAPHVQLFYNDYNEWLPEKRDKICRLLRKLQDEGAPVEGLGMQSHMSIYNVDIDDVKRAIEAYAAFGVRLHVTELDISLYRPEDRSLPAPLLTDEAFERQAQLYIDLFRVYREYSDVIDNVTTWGVADDYTWLNHWPVQGRTNYPLLFYADHHPKPFVQQIIEEAL